MGKWEGTQRSYRIDIPTSGKIDLYISTDGSTQTVAATSTVAPTVTDGSTIWIRVTRVATSGVVTFYQSSDGATWVQVGGAVTGPTGNLFSGTSALTYGSVATGTWQSISADINVLQVLNGINGNTVLNIDTAALTTGSATSFIAKTGQTVTINRSTSGRKTAVVVSPIWLFGTNDFMEVSDNPLIDFGATDSFTVVVVARQWSTPSGYGGWVSKYSSGGGTAWSMLQLNTNQSTYAAFTDTSINNLNSASFPLTATDGGLTLRGFIVNRTPNNVANVLNNTISSTMSMSTIGSLDNTNALWVGRFQTAGNYNDFEFISAAIFRRALTQSEITTIYNYYSSRVK